MNRLKKDRLFEIKDAQVEQALEEFFNNIIDCLVINDFKLKK